MTNHTDSEHADPDEFDVFLCHNSADKTEVQRVADRLRAAGLKPWLDRDQLRPGFPAARGLQDQVSKVKAAAVFVGSSGIGPWQAVEILAFLGELVDRGCPVIPVLLPGCPEKPALPPFLKMNTWVDLREADPDPIAGLYWGITGKKLGDATGGASAPRPRGWNWYSSVESAEAGVVSVLAIAEAIAATTVYAWIAWRFGTLHLTISACVAPFLLLRTPDSVSLALNMFPWSSTLAHEFFDLVDRIVPNDPPRGVLRNIVILIAMVVSVILISLAILGIRCIATIGTTLAHPSRSIYAIPTNWWASVVSVDSYCPIEMLPGSAQVDSRDSEFLQPLRAIKQFLSDDDARKDRFVRYLVYPLFIPTIVILLLLPALFYRWSLKGAALIYSPLVWIVHDSTARTIRVYLQDIVTLAYHRIQRWFAAFVLVLVAVKVYVYYSWDDFVTTWRATPGHRLLDAVVMPQAFPPWQISSAVNAILAWVLYLVADWITARWNRGLSVNAPVIEITLRWLSLLRGVLSVYTIFCLIYLAASLSGRFGLAPMGTGILPWR